MISTPILYGVVVVPAVIGLVQVAKETGIPSRFAPLVAIVFGILAGLAQLQAGHWPWIQAVVMGTALGLSAVGLYSGATSMLNTGSPSPAGRSTETVAAPAAAAPDASAPAEHA